MGCGTRGRAFFIGALRKGLRKSQLLLFGCPGFSQAAWRARLGARERSREGALRGAATRDFYESSHLVRALRISLPQPSSAKGHLPGRFRQVGPSLPDAPATQPLLQVSCPHSHPAHPSEVSFGHRGWSWYQRLGRVRGPVGAGRGKGCQGLGGRGVGEVG